MNEREKKEGRVKEKERRVKEKRHRGKESRRQLSLSGRLLLILLPLLLLLRLRLRLLPSLTIFSHGGMQGGLESARLPNPRLPQVVGQT